MFLCVASRRNILNLEGLGVLKVLARGTFYPGPDLLYNCTQSGCSTNTQNQVVFRGNYPPQKRFSAAIIINDTIISILAGAPTVD